MTPSIEDKFGGDSDIVEADETYIGTDREKKAKFGQILLNVDRQQAQRIEDLLKHSDKSPFCVAYLTVLATLEEIDFEWHQHDNHVEKSQKREE